jgi:cephalosporin hydroxylase
VNNIIQQYPWKAELGENWFTYPILYTEMVRRFPDGSHFVELGSWKGRSASYMGVSIHNAGKKIKFDCVDLWTDALHHGVTGDQVMQLFLNNVSPVGHIVNAVRMDSVKAAELYADKSLDFVFVDADHTHDGVVADIRAWLPKVKKGGVLAGHDYTSHQGVHDAVDTVFGRGDYKDPWGEDCFIIEI